MDIPAIALNSGPMLNGWFNGERTGSGTIVWKARELMAAGEIDYPQFLKLVASSAPSTGHCNTMGTASTMNSLTEALGMCLPGSAAIPAPYRDRQEAAYLTGKRIVEMVREDLKPSDILTRAAFENCIVVNSAIGGSTNAPVHVNAIARHIGVKLDNDDWEKIGYELPLLVNLQPAGEYLGEDYYRAGGVPAVVAELVKKGKIKPALTVNGKTLAENCEGKFTSDRKVIWPYDKPMKKKRRLPQPEGQPVRFGDHEDQRHHAGVPPALPGEPGRPDGLRRHGRGLRRARGLPRAHRRPEDQDHREQRALHPRRRPGGLPRRGRGGEHARAVLPAEEGRDRAALHRRRAAVGHQRVRRRS